MIDFGKDFAKANPIIVLISSKAKIRGHFREFLTRIHYEFWPQLQRKFHAKSSPSYDFHINFWAIWEQV